MIDTGDNKFKFKIVFDEEIEEVNIKCFLKSEEKTGIIRNISLQEAEDYINEIQLNGS